MKADINANDVPDYEEMGRIGESVGLVWGGRFRFRDYCHFQYTGGLALEDLRAGRRPERSPSTQGRGEIKVPSPLAGEGTRQSQKIMPAVCHESAKEG